MKKNYRKLIILVFLLLVASAIESATTQAALLMPGETAWLLGTSSSIRPEIAGPIIEERSSTFAFEIDGKSITGEVSQRLRNFQGFGLMIDYKVTSFDDQGLGLQIGGLITQDFYGVGYIGPLDVDYRIDETGDIIPVTASMQAGFGGPVYFDFGSNPLSSGETSLWMFVGDPNNDLVTFGAYGARLLALDASGTQFSIPFASYVTLIPIPASLPLLASGLLSVFVIKRRRKK